MPGTVIGKTFHSHPSTQVSLEAVEVEDKPMSDLIISWREESFSSLGSFFNRGSFDWLGLEDGDGDLVVEVKEVPLKIFCQNSLCFCWVGSLVVIVVVVDWGCPLDCRITFSIFAMSYLGFGGFISVWLGLPKSAASPAAGSFVGGTNDTNGSSFLATFSVIQDCLSVSLVSPVLMLLSWNAVGRVVWVTWEGGGRRRSSSWALKK